MAKSSDEKESRRDGLKCPTCGTVIYFNRWPSKMHVRLTMIKAKLEEMFFVEDD